MQQWHALRVLSNSEKSITSELEKLKVACECYYPKKTLWRKVHGARRRKVGASREKYDVAKIKGYLFVKADLEAIGTEFWRRVRNIFGWVAINGKPLAIVGGQIERLQEAESSGDYDETQKILKDLRALIGCSFYMDDGLLQGQTVQVISAQETAITVSLMGTGMQAKLPVDFFTKNSHKAQLDEREFNCVR